MGWLKKALGGFVKVASLGLVDMDEKDLGNPYEAQLKRMQEQQKLQQANERNNVAQFEEAGTETFTGSDNRRKKRQAGGYSNLGLVL